MLRLVGRLNGIGRPLFRRNGRFGSSAASSEMESAIRAKIRKAKVVVFIKGRPEKPMCGFSNAVVQILRMHDVTYDSYDVLEDEALRRGIKEFSEWPTIPQVYIDGEFVGGCDILLQMHQSGELIEELRKAGITSALLTRAVDPPKQ